MLTSRESIAISAATLATHYAAYLPVLAGDPACRGRLWGTIPPAGQALSLASAALATCLHAACMWWAPAPGDAALNWSSLAYFVLQTAFLPYLHRGACHGVPAYRLAVRAVLALAAAAILVNTWRVWRLPGAPGWARAASVFVALHVAVVDLAYYGSAGVSAPTASRISSRGSS